MLGVSQNEVETKESFYFSLESPQSHLVNKGLETGGAVIKVMVSKCHHCVVQHVGKLETMINSFGVLLHNLLSCSTCSHTCITGRYLKKVYHMVPW